MQKLISLLRELINQSDNIVFFGGAGVSTESGIPDFRSTDGLYNQKYEYPPETIISHDYFMRYPERFYEFYRDKMIYPESKPNLAHIKLAELEKSGKLKAVITQNIDGLHQAAGSENVLELHGSIKRNYCMRCHKFYNLNYIIQSENNPKCECGGLIKPDVVLYQEQLDNRLLKCAVKYIEEAELLIVGGTSLAVYPAAGLINNYSGKNLVLINKSPTPYDRLANLLIDGKIGEVLADAISF